MTKQKRPDFLLYLLGSTFVRIQNIFKHHIKVTGDVPKGPALILSNHTSYEDFKFIVSASKLHRVSFLCTYHFFTFRFLAFWLKRAGIIPKYQFTTDLLSMKRIKYVVQHGGIVYIAPEGTIYANGKLGHISKGTAKLIKFLNVPVYASRIQGAGLGNAKWSEHSHKDYVSIDTRLILKQEEIKQLDNSVILSRLIDAISYNEFDYQKQNKVLCHAKDKAKGFETMFYKCPVCNSEFTLSTHGNTIHCSNCNTSVNLKDDFRFDWKYFDNYIEWYDWQYECLKKEIEKPDFRLSEEVDYGIDKPGVNNYIKVGHGVLTLSHDGWNYEGTYNGQTVHEHDDLSQVFLATLKCGVHFELPFKNGHCRVFYPENGNRSMKWHLASRAMSELLALKKNHNYIMHE